MITEIVTFDRPPGTTREQALARYRATAPRWAATPGLVREYSVFHADACRGGGVSVWTDRAAVARWHGEEYRRLIREVYGSEPQIRILDTVVEVDNRAGQIREPAAG